MKRSLLAAMVTVASFCSYAQSLPLTAGSSNPLTGDLYIDGTNGNRLIFSYAGVSNNKVLLGSNYSLWGSGSKDDFATYIRDNNPYSIWTNGSQRFFVGGNGYVGIGTTSPQAILDINGAQRLNGNLTFSTDQTPYFISGPANGGAIRIRSNALTATDRDVQFGNMDNLGNWSSYMTVANGGNVGIGTTAPRSAIQVASYNTTEPSAYFYNYAAPGSSRGLVIEGGFNASDYSSDFRNRIGTSLLFVRGDGNVGVGTTSPVSLFQVDDGCSKASIGDAGGSGLNYGTSYLGFNASRSGTSWSINSDGLNNGGGVIYSNIFGDMYFSTIPTTGGSGQTLTDANVASQIAMRINHTDGAVYAKQIYVQTSGWPDFVFKKDYALRPLSEVKAYIDQNQHLPDMPAAEKVEKDGINLGEMNKALLRKVEELTLYLIEKDKKEKEQQEINKSQQQQIDALKQQLAVIAKTLIKD